MNYGPWQWTPWVLSTRNGSPEWPVPPLSHRGPEGDAGAGWLPPRLASVAAGDNGRRAPWHASPPTTGFSNAPLKPFKHPPFRAPSIFEEAAGTGMTGYEPWVDRPVPLLQPDDVSVEIFLPQFQASPLPV